MDRNALMWVLECCLLSMDGHTKKELIEFGCPRNLADMGINLCSYLIKKEIENHNQEGENPKRFNCHPFLNNNRSLKI